MDREMDAARGAERSRPSRIARTSAILAVALALLGTLYTAWAVPAFYRTGWTVGVDPWVPMRAADAIARGDYVHIYSSVGGFVATPGLPIILSPLSFVGQRLGLTEGLGPLRSSRPTMWLIYGPFGYLLGFLLFYGVGRLDRTIGDEIGRRPGRGSGYLLVELAMFGLVIWPTSIVYAHFEEIVALALVLLALRGVVTRDHVRAAVLLGAAVAFKQWAALLIPLLVGWSPPGKRFKVLAWSVGIPAVLILPPLIGDTTHAWNALFHAQVFPSLGRRALWISESHPFAANGFRAGSLVLAVICGWWLRGRDSTRMILAATAVVLTVRLLFEPVLFVPYLCAPVVLLLMHSRSRGLMGWLAAALGAAAMLMFTPTKLPQSIWWPVEVALFVPLVWVAASDVWRRDPERGGTSRSAIETYSGQPV